MRHEPYSNQGFSMLEIMIALSFLVIATLSLTSLIGSSIRVNESSQELTVAHKAAQEVMEQLLAMDIALLASQNGVTFDLIGIPELPNTTIGSISIEDISAGSGELYEITVSVIYAGDYAVPRLNIRLTTRRAKQ